MNDKLGREVFWILLVAFSLSTSFGIYHALDTGASGFDIASVFGGLGIGAAFLARLDRAWAWLVVLLVTLAFLALTVFFYLPVKFPLRPRTWIDNLELMTFNGLLCIAAWRSVQGLLGAQRSPRATPST